MCAPYNLDVVLCTLLLPRYSGAQSEGDTPALMAMLKEVSKGPESAWRSWVGVPASSHAHRLRTPPVIRRARYDVHMPCTLYTCAIDNGLELAASIIDRKGSLACGYRRATSRA